MLLEKFLENFLMKSRILQKEWGDHVLEGRVKGDACIQHSLGKLKGLKEADAMARSLYTSMIDRVVITEKSHEPEPERY